MSATTRPTARRKVVALTVVALGIAGLGLASAAQLTLTPSSIGAGTQVVGSCDDEVDVAFGNAFSAAAKGFAVTQVTVSGISPRCENQTLQLQLLSTAPADAVAGSQIGTVADRTIAAGETSVTLTVSGDVKASDVLGVAAVIAG